MLMSKVIYLFDKNLSNFSKEEFNIDLNSPTVIPTKSAYDIITLHT